ncbi:MAG: hypothetical protein KC615_10130, partial [Anaerolineae bacterium]|nr:hypothetical protein [Anaerolineae bacterium]
PDSPVSVLMINALNDYHVPYYGGQTQNTSGEEFVVISVQQSLEFWQAANDCDPDAVMTSERGNGVATEQYYECASGAAVALISVSEGGHSWPGSQQDRRMGDDPTQAISATDIIWEFFKDHPKVSIE